MDNLQYIKTAYGMMIAVMSSFKPYYKWITFNTAKVVVATTKTLKF